ncbi:MAG TPA: class I SAM-dependent methyltransferase [Fimbriimonas sp.]|nr:class I SAM-dependent methyltransferase [Fimbriimonas sp.]
MTFSEFQALKTDLLDVGKRRRVIGAAWIPLNELPRRLSELPTKDEPFQVAGEGAEEAVEFLNSGCRRAELARSVELGDEQRLLRLWEPNEFLAEMLPSLSPGEALDIACGAGREAVTLAMLGWNVTALDHLPDALLMGRQLGEAHGVRDRISWLCEDVANLISPPVDLVTTFFFLDRPCLLAARQWLRPGGSLVVETFSEVNRAERGKPRREAFALKLGELRELAGDLEILHFSEEWRSGGNHTARLWARSP